MIILTNIQIWWKFYFAIFHFLMKWSLQNFVHATIANLSLHICDNRISKNLARRESQQNKISIKFELLEWLTHWGPVMP